MPKKRYWIRSEMSRFGSVSSARANRPSAWAMVWSCNSLASFQKSPAAGDSQFVIRIGDGPKQEACRRGTAGDRLRGGKSTVWPRRQDVVAAGMEDPTDRCARPQRELSHFHATWVPFPTLVR